MNSDNQSHHRQTSPHRFNDPYIIDQQIALLDQAQRNLTISTHAMNKHSSYDWTGYGVFKNGQHFDVSLRDERNIRDYSLFHAILSKVSEADVFEITLNSNYELVKLALRKDLPTSDTVDIILVLAGKIAPKQFKYTDVVLVTWYFNNKSDLHSTLKQERYAS